MADIKEFNIDEQAPYKLEPVADREQVIPKCSHVPPLETRIEPLTQLHKTIRKFNTGATRDTNEGKLCYAGFENPFVLERFAQYMHKHRKQTDGKLRAGDNWQKLFGEDHYWVCFDSLMRHIVDVWKAYYGDEDVDVEESLCACRFNINAYLFKLLKDKPNGKSSV